MRSSKNTRRIEVDETVYRWRATGQDGLIAVNIWPENGVGALISGSIAYHQEVTVSFSGGHSLSDQLVVTNRLVKRMIEYAIDELNYNPTIKAKDCNLMRIEEKVEWQDAERANDQLNKTLINALIGG